MSNIRSKSSAYINSIVNFTLDTKPYHSKLTEVAVEYRFNDTMNVEITDSLVSRMVHKAAWLYPFVSGGDGSLRTMPLQRMVTPDLLRAERTDNQPQNPGRWEVGNPDTTNTDMLGVPLVFAKKSTIGYGDVWRSSGSLRDNLVRGHDYHHGYGSCEIRVSTAPANDTDQSLRWQQTNAEGVINTATVATRQNGLDITNPLSLNRQVNSLLDVIRTQLAIFPNPAASAALAALQLVVDVPDMPQSYEALLNELVAGSTPVISGFTGWIGEDGVPSPLSRYVDEEFGRLSPAIFFGEFSDGRLRESARGVFPPLVAGNGFIVTSTVAPPTAPPEEWTLTTVDTAPLVLSVTGSARGFLGTVAVGSAFTSTSISFSTAAAAGTPAIGDVALLTPSNRLTVGGGGTQVWNIIKTDPLAYDRPTFTSTRYGYIEDLTGTVGVITLLDITVPSGTLVLTALSPTQFLLSSTAEPLYSGVASVNTTFNDGRVAFTIRSGSAAAFVAGDRFYIQVVNEPARATDFDLYYGYDLDSYDNTTEVYNNTDPLDPNYQRPLNFAFDSRFADYDTSLMSLQVAQNAVSGRKFRLVARPDGGAIDTLKKDGSGPNNAIDLAGPTTGIPPDPPLNSPPVFSMPGDPSTAVDLLAYYSTSFRLEYSDNDFVTTTFVTNVPVGGSFSSAPLGISFTLVAGGKPFIAVSNDDGVGNPRVEGGDMFQFTVLNEPPRVEPVPALFSSIHVPYLLMHADGFWRAPDAAWTIAFSDADLYVVTARFGSGPSIGNIIPGYPKNGRLSVNGTGFFRNLTFKDDLVHFTINDGLVGFAAGDTFRFNTLERKPSLLVHGSASGWQADAVIGEWYWNGAIGFKIDRPTPYIFVGTGLTTRPIEPADPDFARITINSVRPDANETLYTFTMNAGTYVVTRTGAGNVGSVPASGTFDDGLLSVTLSAATQSFSIQLVPDELQFWNGKDTVIVRIGIDALVPQAGDFISVRKAETARLGIALNYDSAVGALPSLLPLAPGGIDADMVSVDTGSRAPPIDKHSPEAAIFNGWLPLVVRGFDAIASPAFFPDVAIRQEVRSAGNNQLVGNIVSLGTLNEPIRFEWDETFFSTYLTQNTLASVVVYGTFLDEQMDVRVHERLNILISGGGLDENALFNDTVNIVIGEDPQWNIITTQQDALVATIEDSPFGGFLAGYDNLPLDAEDATGLDIPSLEAAMGQYDTGLPLLSDYLLAFYLAGLALPTPQEEAELAVLLQRVDAYLQPGGILSTSLLEFTDAMEASTSIFGGTPPTFGLPARGLGISTDKGDTDVTAPTITASVSITQSAIVQGFGKPGLGVDGYATFSDASSTLVASSLPPVGTLGPTYDDTDTPIFTLTPAREFTIVFPVLTPAQVVPVPTINIWQAGAPTLVPVPVVTRVGNNSFSFTLASPGEIKVIVT